MVVSASKLSWNTDTIKNEKKNLPSDLAVEIAILHFGSIKKRGNGERPAQHPESYQPLPSPKHFNNHDTLTLGLQPNNFENVKGNKESWTIINTKPLF